MIDTATFEGGCLCGAVRYRAIAAPIRAVICHCSMCRKHSGAPFWPLSISRLIPSLGSRANRHDSDHRNMRNAAFARGVEAPLPCMNKCLAIVYKLPWVVSMSRNECALMIMYGRKTNCHGLKSRTSCSAFRKTARPCLPRLLMVARPNPAVNADAPRARLRPRGRSPITFVR